jgi:hypothetical protein
MATFLAEAQIACAHQAARQRRIVKDGSDSMYMQLLDSDLTFSLDLRNAGFVAAGHRLLLRPRRFSQGVHNCHL